MADKKDIAAPAILRGASGGTNLIKGRDVRFALDGRSLDPHLVELLAKIAEVNHTNCLAIAELANHVDQIINIVQNFSDIAGNMKAAIEQTKRGVEGEVEGEVTDKPTNH
ncbi:MAG TPA: hypothetical protein VLG09_03920 [Candidatus Saccharimonadales bacterium]|nr:hypothetical protein [Candidatus Saccharimonadales bacterium]